MKLTRPLPVVLAAAVALPCPARAPADPVRLGAEVAGQAGRFSWALPDAPMDYRPRFRPGWSAGWTIEVPFGAHWSLASGLRFMELNEREALTLTVTTTGLGGNTTTTIRSTTRATWNWLALPLRACLRPWHGLPLALEAGPEVRYLTSASTRASLEDPPAAPASAAGLQAAPLANIFEQVGTWDGDVTDRYDRVDLAIAAGLTVEFPLAGHRAGLRARYAHGVTDIAKGDLVRRARSFELGAGWAW